MGIFKTAKKYCQILKQKVAAEPGVTVPVEVTGPETDDKEILTSGRLVKLLYDLSSEAASVEYKLSVYKPLTDEKLAQKALWTAKQLQLSADQLLADGRRAKISHEHLQSHDFYFRSLFRELSGLLVGEARALLAGLKTTLDSFHSILADGTAAIVPDIKVPETRFVDKPTPSDKVLVREPPYAGPDTREL